MSEQRYNQEEVIANINTAFDFLQQYRIKGLKRIKSIHFIKNRALEREKERLSEKLGADHPRVKGIADRIHFNQDLVKGIDLEMEKASINVSRFDKDTWVVHGRVLDSEKKGIKGLTVGLFDEEGNWIRQLGYGCTDKAGYFSIIYTKKDNVELQITETTNLYLYVSDKEYRILYKDSVPLNVDIGQIVYREIYLTEEASICNAPEPGKEDTTQHPDAWIVKGSVIEETGKSEGGFTVSLYDKNLNYAKRLGSIKTDSQGHFTVTYPTEKFKDLIKKNPGIYLRISDKAGKTVYTSKRAVRYKAGGTNFFNIKIKGRRKKAT